MISQYLANSYALILISRSEKRLKDSYKLSSDLSDVIIIIKDLGILFTSSLQWDLHYKSIVFKTKILNLKRSRD